MSDFLPKDYEPPRTTSKYTKFEDGQNVIRVLSKATVGYEYFNKDNKPVRSKTPFESTQDIKKDGKVKEFWAFIAWNYNTKQLEICEITQISIKNAIFELYRDEDYGDPTGYDIKINRKGKELDTEYTVLPSPTRKVSEEIEIEYNSTYIELENLFDGADPFDANYIKGDNKMK